MNKIVFIEEHLSQRGFWKMIVWCENELKYQPEIQSSSICYAFKFKATEDAMAFKLRWM